MNSELGLSGKTNKWPLLIKTVERATENCDGEKTKKNLTINCKTSKTRGLSQAVHYQQAPDTVW